MEEVHRRPVTKQKWHFQEEKSQAVFLAEVKVAMLSKNLILQSPEHPLYPEMFLEEVEIREQP